MGYLEVDLIVGGADRRVVAFEGKLSADVTNNDVRLLTWLRERLGNRLADAAVITTWPARLSPSRRYRRHPRIATRTLEPPCLGVRSARIHVFLARWIVCIRRSGAGPVESVEVLALDIR
jgi:type IV secretory pathway TrbD component